MRAILFLQLFLPLLVAGCGAESVWATDEEVQAAVYRNDEPPSITLYTVLNNRSGQGAHSALLINGSQRLVFDPAGTWYHPRLPERNDVHFGMSDAAVEFYENYHARETFRVIKQTIEVSAEVAEQALLVVQSYGPVPKAMCSNSTTRILRQISGFESIPNTWLPKKTMVAFGELPGVSTVTITDDDDNNNTELLRQQSLIQPNM